MTSSRILVALKRAALAGLLITGSAAAQPRGAPLRVIVQVQSDLDRDLVERARGQLSDLPLDLIVVDELAESEELAARARQVERLSAAHDAAVALWFAAPGEGDTPLLVFVTAPGRDPVLVRRLDGSGTASGLLEAAALVVRSSLRALVDGEPLGVSVERSEPPPQAAAAPAAVDRIIAPEPNAPRPSIAPARLELDLLAGWHGVATGSGDSGHHGLLVRGVVGYGWLELGLGLGASLAVAERDALAELDLARHCAFGSLGLRLLRGELQLSGGLHAGVALFQRSTAARSSSLIAHGARFTAAALLGPWLGFAFMPGPIGVGAQLALDVLPGPPRFVYEGPSREQLAHRPWVLQPRAVIGVQGALR